MLIFLIAVLWVIAGLWLCYKRDWYPDVPSNGLYCAFAVIGAPINFLLIFFKVFLIHPWNNDNTF